MNADSSVATIASGESDMAPRDEPVSGAHPDGARRQPGAATSPLDVEAMRDEFPILSREVNGRPLVYLDSAASSQQPLRVLDRVDRYVREQHANVHRGVHLLSEEATVLYEEARNTVRDHLGARSSKECIFVRGTTEAIQAFERASSCSGSVTVPGVTTRTTSRLTRPLVFRGSSICSQTATRQPARTSRAA